MIAVFAILSTLTVLALAPVLFVVLAEFPGNGFQKIEAFVSAYDGTLLSLGTLFLVSTLAVLAAHLSNRSAERRENYNRKIQAALQIAQFRQDWILELRGELAAVQAIMFRVSQTNAKVSDAAVEEFTLRINNVFLMLNPLEERTKELRSALAEVGAALRSTESDHKKSLVRRFEEIAHAILKAEWERLKSDLEAAHDLEV